MQCAARSSGRVMLNEPRNDFASPVRELATTTASRIPSPAWTIKRQQRKSATRTVSVAIGLLSSQSGSYPYAIFLRDHGPFPVQFGEGLAFLGQTFQQGSRFPEFAVLLMKF
jgi:hypothetical protein